MSPSTSQLWLSARQKAAAYGRDFRGFLKKTCAWFVPMFITAAATAYLSYFYNQKSNTELAVQQQTFYDLQAFRNSGADIDQSIGLLSDTFVDGKGIEEAKSKMRNAISRHVSDALANERALGPDSRAYVEELAQLRTTVDAVSPRSVDTGAELWQKSLRLMSHRRRLLVAAQSRIANR